MPVIQRLLIFASDDVTPISDYSGVPFGSVDAQGAIAIPTVSTDIADARPYLKPILTLAPSEVNFREGSSAIGQVNFQIIDKRTDVANQATGWFTRLLADNGGIPQLLGHRVLIQQGPLATPSNIMDGIIASITQDSSLAGYTIILKDVRERERVSKFFVRGESTSIFPSGSAVAWGLVRRMPIPRYLVREVIPWKGTFRANNIDGTLAGKAGLIELDAPVPPEGVDALDRFLYWARWSDLHSASWSKVGWPTRPYGLNKDHSGIRFHDVALQWRPEAGGVWTTLADMPWYAENLVKRATPNVFVRESINYGKVIPLGSGVGGNAIAIRALQRKITDSGPLKWVVASSLSGTDLPADGARVEFRVVSRARPSDEAPLLVEMNRALLLQKLYDGEFGSFPPPSASQARTNMIRYSRQLANAVWLLSPSLAATANYAPAPDGSMTATRFVASGVGNSYFHQSAVAVAVTGSKYTWTVEAKADSLSVGDSILIFETQAAVWGAPTGAIFFNLTTGKKTSGGGAGDRMDYIGNGYYRISVTRVMAGAGTSSHNPFYVGAYGIAVAGASVIVANGQLEKGARPTRHITTLAAAVTINDSRGEAWVPPIKYNDHAMAAFQAVAGTALFPATQPEEDMRKWVQENIYKPEGWAPWVNEWGEVEPIASYLPSVDEPLLQLDNSNVAADGAGWRLDDASVINTVEFTYRRWYLSAVDEGTPVLAGLSYVEETVRWETLVSTLLMGEKLLTFTPKSAGEVTLDPNGASMRGASNEGGSKLAEARAVDAIDRFSVGAPTLVVRARKGASGVARLRAGNWCVAALSWVPDFVTHIRGINRLMQIRSISDLDPTWREIALEDAGPSGQPIAQPTIALIVAQTDRRVKIDVTVLPAGGGEVQVEYAVSATQPDQISGLWLPLVRTDALGTYYTPPQGSRATVWIRAYGAKPGRRSSATTAPLSVTLSLLPEIVGISVRVGPEGEAVIAWTQDTDALGVRIAYVIHAAGTAQPILAALTSTMDADAASRFAVLPVTLKQGEQLSFSVTPYSAFGGGVASGTAGVASNVLTTDRNDTGNPVLPDALEASREDATSGYLSLTVNDPQKRITLWEYRTQVGNLAPGAWTVWTNPATEVSVAFMDKHLSHIEYRATGYDGFGVAGKPLIGRNVPFSIGKRPIRPTLRANITDAGLLSGTGDGDSDSTSMKFAASVTGAPSEATVRAATSIGTGNRKATAQGLVTVKPGQRYWIRCFAYNANGLESDIAELSEIWAGVSSTPAPDPVITATGSSDQVAYTVTFDAETVRLDVYGLEHTTVPTASNISEIAPRIVRLEMEVTAVGAARTLGFGMPLAWGGNYAQITAVPYDILGRKGALLNMVTQGVAGAVLPSAPTVGAATITATTVAHPISWAGITGGPVAAGWKVRAYVDNVVQADIVLSAGDVTAGTVTLTHTGFVPGSSHTFQYSLVNASNQEGALSASVTRTTTSGGTGGSTLDQPFLSCQRAGRIVELFISPGANNPVGTTFALRRTAVAGSRAWTTTATSSTDDFADAASYYCKSTASGYNDSTEHGPISVDAYGGLP